MTESADIPYKEERDIRLAHKALRLRDQLDSLYSSHIKELIEISSEVKPRQGNTLTSECLADVGGLLKKSSDALTELQRELNARVNLIALILCARLARSSDPEQRSFHGAHFTATPKYKEAVSGLKRGNAKYEEFCKFLGLPKEVVETGIIDFSYMRTQDWLEKQRENLREVPEFLDTYPVYTCTFRKKRDT